VLNVVDGCIPSDLGVGTTDQIEEERRLLYVAMTRARDTLHLVMPQRFYVTQQGKGGDRHVYAQRTRFIPEAILDRFAPVLWQSSKQGDSAAGVTAKPIDVRAQMRRRWS
jgi:DNA helicase-2/ATP-dependent DNA helicase PcrA